MRLVCRKYGGGVGGGESIEHLTGDLALGRADTGNSKEIRKGILDL
jgi:hypothetical protein